MEKNLLFFDFRHLKLGCDYAVLCTCPISYYVYLELPDNVRAPRVLIFTSSGIANLFSGIEIFY